MATKGRANEREKGLKKKGTLKEERGMLIPTVPSPLILFRSICMTKKAGKHSRTQRYVRRKPV